MDEEEEPPLKKARLAVDVEDEGGDAAVVINITAVDQLLPPTSMAFSNTMTMEEGAVDNEGEPVASDALPIEPLAKDASSTRLSPVKPTPSSHPALADNKGVNNKSKDNNNNKKKGNNAKGKGGDGHDKFAFREEEEAFAIGDSVYNWNVRKGVKLWGKQLAQRQGRMTKNCSVGEWDSSVKMVKIVKEKGKMLQSCGRTLKHALYIYAEEAVLLSDAGGIIVALDNNMLSLGDTFNLLMEAKVPMCSYLAYSQLRQMGYIVRRHHLLDCVDGMSNIPLPSIPADVNDIFRSRPPVHIAFDVYRPSQRFKKSLPGKPAFYVIVCRAQDTFPDPRHIKELMKKNPDVPLKIVLTDVNNVTFYDLDYSDGSFKTTSIIEGAGGDEEDIGAVPALDD